MSEDIEISIATDEDFIMANGTVDEQATLGELINDVFSGVPPSNDDEVPDTPKSSSSNDPPNKDYNFVDTEKVKRYTCPSCKKTYISTHESMSHIAPVDMEQEEVLKCPHCGVPSVREALEFTEEIIEARPKRRYIPISRGEKRFLCPHCKRAFNTTLETMLTLIPVITEQGELRTCLYCETPSLKTTLESNADTMLRESSYIPTQADENTSSNSNIQPSRQQSSPDQASTGTPSSQILEGIIHTPAYQNSPNQQPAFQSNPFQQPIARPTLDQQQPAVHPNSNQQSTFGPNTYQQLAANRSSQTNPFGSSMCEYCGMQFPGPTSKSAHESQVCQYRVWYLCPAPRCAVRRHLNMGFKKSAWRTHMRRQHNYSIDSHALQTYRGEVRDPNELTGWRLL